MSSLSNITVVDLTVNLPGPFCSMNLSDLGARVIKVEPPGGDPLRMSNSKMWAGLNRGKESIVLNLKDFNDQQTLSTLALGADVILEGWRPGVAKRLKADYPTLSQDNHMLVYCSISGFGQDGPWHNRPAHDINYLALSGYLGIQTEAEGRPSIPPILLSDLASGLYATIMVLAALNDRVNSEAGTYIDLSMTEAILALLSPEIETLAKQTDAPLEPNITSIPHYGIFECQDGKWLTLGIVHEDHFWDNFCTTANLSDLVGMTFETRMAKRHEIQQRLESVFKTLPANKWEIKLLDADVPGATVVEPSQIHNSIQFNSRGIFADSETGKLVGQPARISGKRPMSTNKPPVLDENGESLRREFAGIGTKPSSTYRTS